MKLHYKPLLVAFLFPVTLNGNNHPQAQSIVDRMTRIPSIRLAPSNLKVGDQAILVIRSYFDKGVGLPITLKETVAGGAVEAIELFADSSFESGRSPDNSDIRIYRITLKKPSYTFVAGDFAGLPNDFKLADMNIYRE